MIENTTPYQYENLDSKGSTPPVGSPFASTKDLPEVNYNIFQSRAIPATDSVSLAPQRFSHFPETPKEDISEKDTAMNREKASMSHFFKKISEEKKAQSANREFLKKFPFLENKIKLNRMSITDVVKFHDFIERKEYFNLIEYVDFLKFIMQSNIQKNTQLFNSNEKVKQVRNAISLEDIFDAITDVETPENWVVIPPGENGAVGTSYLATCIGLLGRGWREDGTCILYCYHYCIEGDTRDHIKNIYDRFLNEEECKKESIELFAIGGQIETEDEIFYDSDDDEELVAGTASLLEEFKILFLVDKYPIKALRFNYTKPGEGITVRMDTKNIIFHVGD